MSSCLKSSVLLSSASLFASAAYNIANNNTDIAHNAVLDVALEILQQYPLVTFGGALGTLALAKYRPNVLKQAAVVVAPTALYLLAKSILGSPDSVVKKLAFEQNGAKVYEYTASGGSDPVDIVAVLTSIIVAQLGQSCKNS